MARKRTEFTPDVDAQIDAMAERGDTAEAISKTLTAAGVRGASRATVGRRLAERRGPVATPRSPASSFAQDLSAAGGAPQEPPDPPDSEDGLPESDEAIEKADPGTLERWIARAEVAGRRAATVGNLAAIGQMGRLAVTLQEAKRKATPLPKPDPNDSPDMRAAAKRAREELHKYVEAVVVP